LMEERLIFRERVTDWTSTSYLTHGLFPYPARFIPQIPRYFIKEYMHNHHAILDPMAGCGTSLVEARLLGYDSYGVEMNPLGRLLTEVKTTPLDIGRLQSETSRLNHTLDTGSVEPTIPEFPNREYWFDPEIQGKVGRIRTGIEQVRDHDVKNFFLVCLASIVRKCSNADPRISKPVNTKRMQEQVKTRGYPDPYKLFKDRIGDYSARVVNLSNFLEDAKTKAQVIGEDARKVNLPDKSVHLIITSPPFINAQEYFRTTKFEIWWAGLADAEKIRELETRLIGVERVGNGETEKLGLLEKKGLEGIDKSIRQVYEKDKIRAHIIYLYFREMETVFREMMRVLDDTGCFAITIGDNTIRKIPVETHQLVIDLAEYVGFKTHRVAYDVIKVHSLAIKRNETAGLITKEWAMVFKK